MKLFTGAKWGGTGISRLTSGVKNLDTFLGSDRANEHIQMEGNYGGDAGHWAENRQGGYGRGDSWVFNVHLGVGGRCWSSGRFQTGETEADTEREEEGRGGLLSALTAAPHSHKMTLREKKNCSIYLPFPSIYLASSIHQYLSFPRRLRHV